ncbi:TPA: fimbrial protein, partial [Enterobacter asburiae]|nr:fimbrial protein [Enterobacter asburiae]
MDILNIQKVAETFFSSFSFLLIVPVQSKATVECSLLIAMIKVPIDISHSLNISSNVAGKSSEYKASTPQFNNSILCTGQPGSEVFDDIYVNPYLPVSGKDGPWTFYRVDDYFSTALSEEVCGQTKYVPSHKSNVLCGKKLYIGKNGRISMPVIRLKTLWTIRFRVERAFSGPRTVNLQDVFKFYVGYIITNRSTQQIISLVGNINVPEVCTINAGQIIQVNLGDVGAGRFGGKGQKPDGYTPVTTSAPVTCNDAAAQRNVRVSLAATPSPDLNTAIRTSNPDVGVVVTDVNDRVVQPNV